MEFRGFTMSHSLFCYGTLTVTDIFSRVIERPVSQPAIDGNLPEYGCFKVNGEIFPGIRPEKESTTSGCVYRNLTLEEIRKLDLYEGELYRRQKVRVETASGPVIAWAYLIKPEYYEELSEEYWCRDSFLATGIREFLGG